LKRVSPHTPLQKLFTAGPAAGSALCKSPRVEGGEDLQRLLGCYSSRAGSCRHGVKSLWKGVWGKTFLQKGLPQQ